METTYIIFTIVIFLLWLANAWVGGISQSVVMDRPENSLQIKDKHVYWTWRRILIAISLELLYLFLFLYTKGFHWVMLFNMLVMAAIFIMIFSFVHNGVYMVCRNKIARSMKQKTPYPDGIFDNGTTAKFEVPFHLRLWGFIAGLFLIFPILENWYNLI